MSMILLQAIYFFLPAYLANMAPVFAAKLMPSFSYPLDGYRTHKGKRLLGDNKTWRGLFAGVIVATFVVIIQRMLIDTSFGFALSIVPYHIISPWLLGPLFGIGALGGDAVKSFFKRKKGIISGQSWPVWDQLDFVIGGLVLVSFIYRPSFWVIVIILVISPALHKATNVIGYWLGLKKVPW